MTLSEYTKWLVEQIPSAMILPKARIEGGNWQPAPNQCHDNVDIWCAHKPSYRPVRGWLYFDLPGLRIVKFVAHSAVRKPDGSLADITPSHAFTDYPFIEAGLSDSEYQQVLEQCSNHEINCNAA